MKGSLVPCGHTFSDSRFMMRRLQRKNVSKWVRNIMEYWKAEGGQELNREQVL